MIDDVVVLKIERIRDDVEALKVDIRQKYSAAHRQVTAPELRARATAIAERWLVEVAGREDVGMALGGTALADRNINFQRLMTYAERATQRKKYDQAIAAILKDFRSAVTVPLKAKRHMQGSIESVSDQVESKRHRSQSQIVFVGQSFSEADRALNETIARALVALGLTVTTGEKPRADQVSKKVKDRIDQSEIFVGVFTRRDKLEGKNEWATSPWIVDEKAYALAGRKKLVLLREDGVSSIGGLQGDYEYLTFDRTNLADLIVKLIETFREPT